MVVRCFECGKTEADIRLTKTELRKRLSKKGWASGAPWQFLSPDHPEYARARQERKPRIDKCPECMMKSIRHALDKLSELPYLGATKQ